jgi:alpha-amylase
MRLKKFSLFSQSPPSSLEAYFDDALNEKIMRKVAGKCYLPANSLLLGLLETHPEFRVSFSLTGVFLEQCKKFSPEVLESFSELARTGKVEFLSETYYHSLSSLFSSKQEFIEQIELHRREIGRLAPPSGIFRNTEALFSNQIGSVLESLGYCGVMTEGVEHILGWRSPNYIYASRHSPSLGVLFRNYKLSDDVGYRFSARNWSEYPLTANKYASWLAKTPGECCNIFMDYETFGEHHWEDTGIFEFLRALPREILTHRHLSFSTPSQAASSLSPKGEVDIHSPISWADMERDTSAWLGNEMQRSCFEILEGMEGEVRESESEELLHSWRLLQNSDHLYYLSTKSLSDQDVHNYFSPYESPFEAYINFMNILQDFRERVRKEKRQ